MERPLTVTKQNGSIVLLQLKTNQSLSELNVAMHSITITKPLSLCLKSLRI